MQGNIILVYFQNLGKNYWIIFLKKMLKSRRITGNLTRYWTELKSLQVEYKANENLDHEMKDKILVQIMISEVFTVKILVLSLFQTTMISPALTTLTHPFRRQISLLSVVNICLLS